LCALGTLCFVTLSTLAAQRYPGGTWWNHRTHGYDFWQNFLCDLFHHHALNGRVNTTGAQLATVGAAAMLLGMGGFFALIACLAPDDRAARLARRVGVPTCVAGLAMPLTPSDRYRVAHLAVMLVLSLPALVSLGAATVACVRVGLRERRWVLVACAALTAVALGLDAVAYAVAIQTRALDLLLAPLQRLALLAMLCWIAATLHRTRPWYAP